MKYIRLVQYLTVCSLLSGALGCRGIQYPGEKWVNDIELRGNSAFPQDKILEGLSTRPTSIWPFSDHEWYDPNVLDMDLLRIEAFYATHGFFDARVTNKEVVPVKDDEAVEITIFIDEGKPTLVKTFEIKGLPADARVQRRIERELNFKVGDRFDYPIYEKTKRSLQIILQETGYPYTEVTGDAKVNRELHTANVTLMANTGPLVHFGEIKLVGHGELPAGKILRNVTWENGDRYDPEEVDETRLRLAGLRVFSSINIDLPEEPTETPEMKIEVTQAKLHELRLGGGIGIESGRQEVRLRADWTIYNFLGGLRTLAFRARPAYVAIPTAWNPQRTGPAFDSEVRFTQPDIFASNIALFARVGYTLDIREGYRHHGPDLQAGFERAFWRRKIYFSTSWNMELRDFFDVTPEAARVARDIYQTSFEGMYRPVWLEQSATLDLRDARIDPRAGLYLGIRAEEGFGGIGSAFDYIVFEPEARGYIPLGTKRVILALRAVWGRLWPLREGDSPITRRLEMGGPTSHRGFSYGRLAPQAFDPIANRRVPIGGNQAILFSTDVRVRTFKLFGGWVNVIGFVDAGDVTATADELDLGNLHWAAGGGLQYQTPIGSLALSYGRRFTRLNEDPATTTPDPNESGAFHLTIGDAF